MSSISEYKTYLWDYLQKYHNVTSPKRFFHCLNPNHIDNNPSMMFTDKYNICKCFSCGASYDIYDLIGLDYDLHNFKEQLEKVQELYLEYVPVKKEAKKDIDNKIYDYTNYYNKCFKNRYKTTYLEQRGITRELIDKYKIGYDEERALVVFPINKHCYFARSVVNNDKIKSRGSSDIWNKKYIKENLDDIKDDIERNECVADLVVEKNDDDIDFNMVFYWGYLLTQTEKIVYENAKRINIELDFEDIRDIANDILDDDTFNDDITNHLKNYDKGQEL